MTTAIDIARFLITQGLAFRGHNELDTSLNRGNFLERLEWHKRRDPKVKTAFDHLCPKNAKTTCPEIQKDITDSCAKEISKVIKDTTSMLCLILMGDSPHRKEGGSGGPGAVPCKCI